MRTPRFVLAVAFAAAAFIVVLWITRPPGPGLDPDAMSYLGAARSFAESGTLRIPTGSWDSADGTSPLSHFPPGFSLVLAGPVALGADPIGAARVVEALAAAATAALVTWLAASGGGLAGGALAGVFLFVTPGFALDHLRVLSEPLFLALAVLTVLLMVRSPDRPLRYGIAAALASLVRYAGVSLGGAAALWALSRPGTLRRRLAAAALALAPTVLLQGAWTLRTYAESAGVRTFGLRGGLGPTLAEGWATLTAWLVPGVAHPLIGTVIALVVVGLAAVVVGRAVGRARSLLAAAGLASACYAGVVLFARLFADEGIPLDERLLSPLFLFISLGVAVAVGSLWSEARPAVRWTGACVLAAWLVASGWRSGAIVAEAREGGWGYASADWLASDLVRWLRTEGAGYSLFSNNPADAWFATGRRSWTLPEAADSETAAAFGEILRRRNGLVVGFEKPLSPMVRPDELAGRLALPIIARLDGAAVWGPKSP
jgi:hypothetical protein